jgi:hypothetical protein
MKYNSSDLAIIIPTINKKNIKIILHSIKQQTKKPGQTIFISNTKLEFKSSKKFIFTSSKISNQIYQRNLGLDLINDKIKLILQLDDKFYLHKNAIENLIDEWNSLADNVAGIGIKSNFEYENVNKFKFLKYISLTGSNEPGKVLISGFNNKIISSKKFIDVDWLQGGLSSWRLKHIPNIFKRKFPLLKWSILEDLIFSYDVKFNKNFQLKMSNSLKAYVIKSDKKNFNSKHLFYRGFQYAKMHKIFVYINKKKLSKIAFYYSYIFSSFMGILWCCFKIDKKIFFYFGRLLGIFINIKNIKVL